MSSMPLPRDLVIYGKSWSVTQVASFDLPSLMKILPALCQGSASASHIFPLLITNKPINDTDYLLLSMSFSHIPQAMPCSFSLIYLY